MTKRMLCIFTILLLVIVCASLPLSATAQQGGTTTYVYDDNARLHAVISPTGEAVIYEYDAAGNITAIRRLAGESLAILSFSPDEGLPGDLVTFIGVGFGGSVTDVSFNGASATIVSVTASMVVATVPQAATTGPVTVTTPRGAVTTIAPFTIAGGRIIPSFAALKFGQNVQFTAELMSSTLDQNVQWTVDDAVGGNSKVGTISSAGLYTAPNSRHSSVTIRAASIADISRFAEAHVSVSDPSDVQSVFAGALSVQRGDTISLAPLAPAVTVRYNAVADLQAALSRAVTIRYGTFSGLTAAIGPGVTVQRADTVPTGGLSKAISVQYENGSSPYSSMVAVSSTTGPYVQTITPSNLTRGTTVPLTINGVGLTGATTLRFLVASGSLDTGLSVSNISVSNDGAALTAIVTVSAGAAPGNHIVVIATPNGDSVIVDLGINTINVQ